jgi:hypothetical protein
VRIAAATAEDHDEVFDAVVDFETFSARETARLY